MGKINPFKPVIRALASFRVLEQMAACHPKRLHNPDYIPPPVKRV
jgi:hypothetical protein